MGNLLNILFNLTLQKEKLLLMDDTNNYIELDSKAITLKSELYTGTKIHMEEIKILRQKPQQK